MAESQVDYTNLPPGWDSKFDHRSGKHYFINHFTKITTWEDPRGRYKQLYDGVPAHVSSEHIPLQPMHGSPYHVYPAKNYPPAQAAFQGPPSGIPSVSASPQLAVKIQQLEMSPVSRASAHTPRSISQLSRHTMQETSFSTATSVASASTAQIDTDAVVTKINTMFPTVNETHIRMLLKKYYNREAVVISALQVEKHPLTTPGPYATPPPPGRHFYNISGTLHMTPPMGRDNLISRTESPILRPSSCASGSYGSPRGGEGYRSSPKPHSSPKMKLRYLKGIFPTAEETLILDILASSDNNVQKASDKLLTMGYDKKDSAAHKLSIKKKEEEKARKIEMERTILQQPPKIKSMEEKNNLKSKLQLKYNTVADRIIAMALESVDYSEEKACQILDIVVQEDNRNKAIEQENNIDDKDTSQSYSSSSRSSSKQLTEQQLHQEIKFLSQDMDDKPTDLSSSSPESKTDTNLISPTNGIRLKQNRPKAKNDHTKISTENDGSCGNKIEFKTIIARTSTNGPNAELFKGPNADLLLVDYVTWRGANTDYVVGRNPLAKGPDPNYSPRGPNNELCNGPTIGLAKGSIYSQITRGMADVKVN